MSAGLRRGPYYIPEFQAMRLKQSTEEKQGRKILLGKKLVDLLLNTIPYINMH